MACMGLFKTAGAQPYRCQNLVSLSESWMAHSTQSLQTLRRISGFFLFQPGLAFLGPAPTGYSALFQMHSPGLSHVEK